jgi:hypothetical protein
MLMSTDLLRHQQQWKEGLKDIRNIMSQVEGQVCRYMVLFIKKMQICNYVTAVCQILYASDLLYII